MAVTTNLGMPELDQGQKNADITHNEALNILDLVVQAVVQDMTHTAPPTGVEGEMYIPLATASGDWTGWENDLAGYVNGVWIRIVPQAGWIIYNLDTAKRMSWSGSAWIEAGNVSTTGAPVVDNAIVRYDTTTGDSIQESSIFIDDDSAIYGHRAKISAFTTDPSPADTDSGTVFVGNPTGAINFTLPATLGKGTKYTIINRSAFNITVIKDAADTLESLGSSVIVTQSGGKAEVIKLDNTTTNTWGLYGDLS